MSSGVEFDEDKWGASPTRPRGPQTSGGSGYSGTPNYGYSGGREVTGLAGWLIRHGLAKNERVAQWVLLAVVIVNIVITIVVARTYF